MYAQGMKRANEIAANPCPTQILLTVAKLHVVERLVAKGAGVDKATARGATPLFIAARNGHFNVVERLTAAMSH